MSLAQGADGSVLSFFAQGAGAPTTGTTLTYRGVTLLAGATLGAVSLANSGDQDGAENRLESGKSADAKHEVTGYAEAMEALGAAYMTAGDEEKADELYQTLVDEGFSSTEVYNRWMMAAMEKGNYEEALQHAEAGLALSDDRAKKEIAFNQAVCYEYLGQYEKALELFRSYEEQYGQDEKADHEIAFLVTR